MINWHEQAIEYLKEYGNDDSYISEWIDSLVPHFYYDIMQEALRLDAYHLEIENSHLGQSIWKIFQWCIFENYQECFYEAFFEALEEFDEEE
tara:strand:- start:8 stop:283 length:276 start_codon:yes stop_codon:yes gene_type:complete